MEGWYIERHECDKKGLIVYGLWVGIDAVRLADWGAGVGRLFV